MVVCRPIATWSWWIEGEHGRGWLPAVEEVRVRWHPIVVGRPSTGTWQRRDAESERDIVVDQAVWELVCARVVGASG